MNEFIALKYFILSIMVYVAVTIAMQFHDSKANKWLLFAEVLLSFVSCVVFFVTGGYLVWVL